MVRLFTSTMDSSIVFLEGQRARDSRMDLGIGILVLSAFAGLVV
jgi:hypothetical protein